MFEYTIRPPMPNEVNYYQLKTWMKIYINSIDVDVWTVVLSNMVGLFSV